MKRKCFHCRKPAKYPSTIGKAHCGEVECGMALHQYIQSKKRQRQEKAFKEKKKRVRLENINNQLKLTQDVFNKMRRLECLLWFIDQGKEPECISCGKKHMDWCCGHYKTTGQTSVLRFDKKNTHLQCNRYCNRGLSGNIEGNKNTRGYKQGLYEVYGADTADSILDYLENEQHKIKRWNGAELKEMRKEFSEEVRRLEALIL